MAGISKNSPDGGGVWSGEASCRRKNGEADGRTGQEGRERVLEFFEYCFPTAALKYV